MAWARSRARSRALPVSSTMGIARRAPAPDNKRQRRSIRSRREARALARCDHRLKLIGAGVTAMARFRPSGPLRICDQCGGCDPDQQEDRVSCLVGAGGKARCLPFHRDGKTVDIGLVWHQCRKRAPEAQRFMAKIRTSQCAHSLAI